MSNALQETRSMLKNLAVEYGPNSPITRIAYNMLEQTELLPTYSRPAWASHEVMTLPWRIEWQKKHLEMIDIVERLRFDSARFEAQFSKGVATNIDERKSTRLNSSHHSISYAVFCLKKKK